MKEIIFALIVILSALTGLVEASLSSWEIQSVVLTERIWSKYVTVGGVNLHNVPTINNNIVISLKNGVYAEIWNSAGLNDLDLSSDRGDEIDYTLAWSKKFSLLNLNAGVIYLDFIPLCKSESDKLRIIAEAGKSFSLPHQTFSLFVRYEWNQPVSGKIPTAGSWIWLGSNHFWEFNQSISLKTKAYLMYDNTKQEGVDGIFQTAFSWQVTRKLSFEPLCLKLYKPIWKSSDKRFEHVEGGGLTYKF